MNIAKANEIRASLGLAPLVAQKDSKQTQRKQRANQQARAARDQAIRDARGRKSK